MISDGRRPSYLLGRVPNTFANGKFVNWFVIFDETKLRPFLIRNYSLQNVELQDHLDDVVSRAQHVGQDNVEASIMVFENSMIVQKERTIGGDQVPRSYTTLDIRPRGASLYTGALKPNQLLMHCNRHGSDV